MCAPPWLTGTNVGAPSRVRLERANSTENGVSTSIRRMTTASSSAPGSSVMEPNAKIPMSVLNVDSTLTVRPLNR